MLPTPGLPVLLVQLSTQLLLLFCCFGGCAAVRRRSNAIIVYADDFGFDIAGFGHSTLVTPQLDRMIAEGAKLTQYYSGENVCTPSRGAVLTGRHAARSGLIVGVPYGQCVVGSAPMCCTQTIEATCQLERSLSPKL